MDKTQRQYANCGWIPAPDRKGRALVPPDYPYDYPEVCSGYYTSLPAVIEAARAASWRREGALSEFYDTKPNELVRFAIDVIAGEFKSVEQNSIRKSKEG